MAYFIAVIRTCKKQIKELEKHKSKLQEYDKKLEQLCPRNSYSKATPSAFFMHTKEDAMKNGQTKPEYHLQIATKNQFITDFGLFPNPTDTLTLIPLLYSYKTRYGHLASTIVADLGYDSEGNYHFMDPCGAKPYVEYNRFHLEHRPRYKTNPFYRESLHYNPQEDYPVCPMGQHIKRNTLFQQTFADECNIKWTIHSADESTREICFQLYVKIKD